MASISNVGEIVVKRKKMYVEWKIPNYFSRPQEVDVHFASPPFCFFNAQWFITIYPNGCREFYSDGWIDLYLNVLRPVSSYSVSFKLGIKYLGETICKGPGLSTFDSSNKGYGWLNICEKHYLFQLMQRHAPGGNLVIYCYAKSKPLVSVNDEASQTALNSNAVLCRNFQDLLPNEHESDLIIVVRGRKFQVHKRILQSRFPAFSITFKRIQREKREWIIRLFDCDPDAYQDFLKYAYTGKLEKMSWDNVIHLFKISEKYRARELKQQCVNYMIDELWIDKAYDVLVLADMFNHAKLKMRAKNLLTENLVRIKTTDKWKYFMNQNPLLAVEILTQFVPGTSA